MILTNFISTEVDLQGRRWEDFHWEALLTLDGSWTLRDLAVSTHELMHHRAGAFSETQYIFGRVLPDVFDKVEYPFVLNLGLGLGYNELLLATYAHQSQHAFQGVTFEKDEMLLQLFAKALWRLETEVPEPFYQVYKKVLSFYSREGINLFKSLMINQKWRWEGALSLSSPDSFFRKKVNLYFWDPFSSKTSPDLWNEDALADFFEQTAHPTACWLTTYACNGTLKRALEKAGFHVKKMPGFSSKKNSLIAFRS